MAIQNRRGVHFDLDKSKLLPGEFAISTDTGVCEFCFAPGNVKTLTTKEDLQLVLDSSPASYSALQQLLTDLKNNPSELTNILNNITDLNTQLDTKESYDDRSSGTGTALSLKSDDSLIEISRIEGASYQDVSVWGSNLITNGDFSNSTTGWETVNVTMTVSSNKARLIANTVNGEHYIDYNFNAPIAGHKYYAKTKFESIVTGKAAVSIYNRKSDGTYEYYSTSTYSTNASVSIVAAPSSLYVTPSMRIRIRIVDANSANVYTGSTEEVTASYVMLLDLTAIFGSGKEPTAAQVDAMLSAIYTNSWFNGKGKLTNDTTTYVANSPSPDYPAPITVPINFNVTACGKNVFNQLECINLLTSGICTLKIQGKPNSQYTASTNIPLNVSGGANVFIGLAASFSSVANGVNSNTSRIITTGLDGIFYIGFRKNVSAAEAPNLNSTNLSDGTYWVMVNNDSVVLPYETYKSNKITVTQELKKLLNGVCDTIERDSNGKWGNVPRVGKEIFDGSADEPWAQMSTAVSGKYRFYLPASYFVNKPKANPNNSTVSNLICNRFKPCSPEGTFNNISGINISIASDFMIYHDALSAMSVADFKAWLQANPIEVHYELATQTKTIISDQYLQSYYPLTNILSTANPSVSITAAAKSQLWYVQYQKVNKSDIVQTDQVNDATKYPSAAVTYGLGTKIGTIANLQTTIKTDLVNAVNEGITKISNKISKGDLLINVKDYGAKGDGTTNDTTAFVNALSALSNGGILLVPQGTYLINQTLYVPSYTKIIGSGNAIIKRNGNINAIMLTKSDGIIGGYDACKNISVEGITLDAQQSLYTSTCTMFASGHAKNIHISKCSFINLDAWHMIEFNGTINSSIKNCTFYNYGYGSGGSGASEMVQLDYAGDAGAFPWYGPYDNTPCQNITIEENVFEHSLTKAIGNHSFAVGVMSKNIIILNNMFSDVTQCAISLSDVNGLNIISNKFAACAYAITMSNQQNSIININVKDNTYIGTRVVPWVSAEGRFLSINENGMNSLDTTNINVSGNSIKDPNTHGIAVTASNVAISNNIISGCYRDAIFCYGGAFNVVSNNICRGNNIESLTSRADIVLGGNSSVVTDKAILNGNDVESIIVNSNTTNAIVLNNIMTTITSGSASVHNNIIGGTFTA